MTHDLFIFCAKKVPYKSQEVPKNATTTKTKKMAKNKEKCQNGWISYYWFYYLHTPREWLSPYAGFFHPEIALYKFYEFLDYMNSVKVRVMVKLENCTTKVNW